MNNKIIRITTVPLALRNLLRGQMKYMSVNGFEVVMISADGAGYKEVLENEQCRYIIVPMTRKITPLQDLKCLFQLYRILSKEKPAIVHTHTPKAGLLGMIAAALCGTKIRIHTVAGLPLMTEHGLKYQLLKFIEKLTYRAALQVWPNSNSLYRYILDHKMARPGKLKVIHKGSSNGIDLQRFNKGNLDPFILNRIKQEIQFNVTSRYLLFIGRLVTDKGIGELVKAFSGIQQKHPDLKLILVGNYEHELDPLKPDIIKEIQTNPAIIDVGWSEHGEYYMDIADVFVFPSHREGFPNVVLQAGAMDLPVICTRIPGNVDIVDDGVTGLIFDPGNESQLAEKIIYALNNKNALSTMARSLKEKIYNDFGQEKIWESILEEYNTLLDKANKQAVA